jgi:outer membrane protein assembly factor BamD
MFRKIIYISLILLIISSCSEYQKILKSSDYELKYKAAITYYEKNDFVRAAGLLEELKDIYRGTAKAEKIYFYYAGSLYGQKQYILAGYHYGVFARTYPQSKYTEESAYKSAYCSYLNASPPSLDVSYTQAAINDLQLFIEKYPKSEKVKECNNLIDDLRERLEIKAFNNAKLFYKMRDYKASVIALKNVLIDFPDTKYREEILYLIVKSSYLLAKNSVKEKKNERYQKTISEYFIFADTFPESEKTKELKRYYEKSKKVLHNK